MKRHEVICILNFVFVLCLFILNSLVLHVVCVAAVMHKIFYIFILHFYLQSLMLNFKL